ncbi:MAG: type II toxin-antitoxin system RelB/DinJ family antitoxin [Tissierellia bacterium]|nr:type II toxin-antitoxin system RelB/DinJ family antitoxin [Tissierellia bacterium]
MAQINLKVDDNVKKKAEYVCNELGLSLSAAINIYLRKIGRENKIPFELSIEDPFYSESNIKYLEKKLEEYKKGKLTLETHNIIED